MSKWVVQDYGVGWPVPDKGRGLPALSATARDELISEVKHLFSTAEDGSGHTARPVGNIDEHGNAQPASALTWRWSSTLVPQLTPWRGCPSTKTFTKCLQSITLWSLPRQVHQSVCFLLLGWYIARSGKLSDGLLETLTLLTANEQ